MKYFRNKIVTFIVLSSLTSKVALPLDLKNDLQYQMFFLNYAAVLFGVNNFSEIAETLRETFFSSMNSEIHESGRERQESEEDGERGFLEFAGSLSLDDLAEVAHNYLSIVNLNTRNGVIFTRSRDEIRKILEFFRNHYPELAERFHISEALNTLSYGQIDFNLERMHSSTFFHIERFFHAHSQIDRREITSIHEMENIEEDLLDIIYKDLKKDFRDKEDFSQFFSFNKLKPHLSPLERESIHFVGEDSLKLTFALKEIKEKIEEFNSELSNQLRLVILKYGADGVAAAKSFQKDRDKYKLWLEILTEISKSNDVKERTHLVDDLREKIRITMDSEKHVTQNEISKELSFKDGYKKIFKKLYPFISKAQKDWEELSFIGIKSENYILYYGLKDSFLEKLSSKKTTIEKSINIKFEESLEERLSQSSSLLEYVSIELHYYSEKLETHVKKSAEQKDYWDPEFRSYLMNFFDSMNLYTEILENQKRENDFSESSQKGKKSFQKKRRKGGRNKRSESLQSSSGSSVSSQIVEEKSLQKDEEERVSRSCSCSSSSNAKFVCSCGAINTEGINEGEEVREDDEIVEAGDILTPQESRQHRRLDSLARSLFELLSQSLLRENMDQSVRCLALSFNLSSRKLILAIKNKDIKYGNIIDALETLKKELSLDDLSLEELNSKIHFYQKETKRVFSILKDLSGSSEKSNIDFLRPWVNKIKNYKRLRYKLDILKLSKMMRTPDKELHRYEILIKKIINSPENNIHVIPTEGRLHPELEICNYFLNKKKQESHPLYIGLDKLNCKCCHNIINGPLPGQLKGLNEGSSGVIFHTRGSYDFVYPGIEVPLCLALLNNKECREIKNELLKYYQEDLKNRCLCLLTMPEPSDSEDEDDKDKEEFSSYE